VLEMQATFVARSIAPLQAVGRLSESGADVRNKGEEKNDQGPSLGRKPKNPRAPKLFRVRTGSRLRPAGKTLGLPRPDPAAGDKPESPWKRDWGVLNVVGVDCSGSRPPPSFSWESAPKKLVAKTAARVRLFCSQARGNTCSPSILGSWATLFAFSDQKRAHSIPFSRKTDILDVLSIVGNLPVLELAPFGRPVPICSPVSRYQSLSIWTPGKRDSDRRDREPQHLFRAAADGVGNLRQEFFEPGWTPHFNGLRFSAPHRPKSPSELPSALEFTWGPPLFERACLSSRESLFRKTPILVMGEGSPLPAPAGLAGRVAGTNQNQRG
jgi:hypothetical protein